MSHTSSSSSPPSLSSEPPSGQPDSVAVSIDLPPTDAASSEAQAHERPAVPALVIEPASPPDSTRSSVASSNQATSPGSRQVKFAALATVVSEHPDEHDDDDDDADDDGRADENKRRESASTDAQSRRLPALTHEPIKGSVDNLHQVGLGDSSPISPASFDPPSTRTLLSAYSDAKSSGLHIAGAVDTESKIEAERLASLRASSAALQKTIEPFTITMEDLSYSIEIVKNDKLRDRLAGRKKEVTRKMLLKEVTGALHTGTMTALMGPSGAGKSTLLDVIAGRKSSGYIDGTMLFNGQPRSHDFKRLCGYVEQSDILLGTLTVRELLYFTAKLRLPASTGDAVCMKRVEEVIAELGLTSCADVLIGDERHRGISGGQAKRVNIGIELLTCPSILFLDEPTSGLDSTTAFDIMRFVRKIRDRGTTVVCTIHQPSTDIYRLFDRLMLLVAGEVVYLGPAANAVDYFVQLGYKHSPSVNPAEFIVSVTSDHHGKAGAIEGPIVEQSFFAQQYRRSALAEMRKVSTRQAARHGSEGEHQLREEQDLFVNNALFNFRVLLQRNFKKASGDPAFFRSRVIMPSIIAILFLLVYRDSPHNQSGIRNRQALISLTVTMFSIGANQLLGGLIEDRKFFTRERAAATYQVSSYFLANMFIELPYMILKGLFWSIIIYWGCNFARTADQFFFFTFVAILLADFGCGLAQLFAAALPTLEQAAAAMTTFPLLFVLCSGFFIFPQNMPDFWHYTVYYISYCNYALAALLINEFHNADQYVGSGGYCLFNTTYSAAQQCPIALAGCETTSSFPLSSDQILKSVGVQDGFFHDRFANLMMVILIWIALRFLGYLALRFIRHGKR
ncbi:hypothetical protein CAOG_06644 [Capsaspora owczarzaki ATCC 30864]|uniref:ABC transporter domain-containing protein n=1 Tax=Capsaspora owczarzaki (strain ATCC 30864) TaxID=595528 RepID=A0A0D2VXD0_CAPO3|nr:hypothetical protein CAOG_06644 [Capsaspora owczarzaki ATCC 30864]KJE96302.1 hypothetical protein CAOG_006644 [Capsaspora owczarzaki ATCC 30864]|eukprot:XP_004344265.1 hypothetical protein CAOG_06644 [Capsaspora owczarzaki ATCC 30864]